LSAKQSHHQGYKGKGKGEGYGGNSFLRETANAAESAMLNNEHVKIENTRLKLHIWRSEEEREQISGKCLIIA
jgi:hypothetical protein